MRRGLGRDTKYTPSSSKLPYVPEDIFFLIDADGSRRSRVNEAAAFSIVSTVYFILGILKTDLWSQSSSKYALEIKLVFGCLYVFDIANTEIHTWIEYNKYQGMS